MSYDHLILVADDDQCLAETTCELLQLYDINAKPCFSGAEVISLSQDLRPEAVILDTGMTSPNGFEAFSMIRASHGCSTVPIIAVTAGSDLNNSRRIIDTGFAAHLVKPVKIDLLAATIKKLAEIESNKAWVCAGRHDALTAQRLEVALVYKEMLGYDEARKYLESVAVPLTLASRILDSAHHRV